MTKLTIPFLHRICFRILLLSLSMLAAPVLAQQPHFQVLAFYSTNVEKDHVMFAEQAIQFYSALAKRDGFDFATTTNWDDLNATRLKQVQVVLWLDDFPQTAGQRAGFVAGSGCDRGDVLAGGEPTAECVDVGSGAAALGGEVLNRSARTGVLRPRGGG